MVPFTVSVLRRFAFSYPAPVFGNPIAGIVGLLFDQELGILIYAPALALGFVGLWQMLFSRDAMVRHRGRELACVFGVLMLSAGAVVNWWQTLAPPGRPLVPVLPLLALPIAWSYLGATERSVRRSLYQVLAVLGVALTLAMILSDQGTLIVQDRDGSSRLLQWLTMLWPAWQVAPAVASSGVRSSAGLIALWIGRAHGGVDLAPQPVTAAWRLGAHGHLESERRGGGGRAARSRRQPRRAPFGDGA